MVPTHDRPFFERAQLEILQGILAELRFLAGDQTPHREMYDILDRIEFLPTLIGSEMPDDFELFRDTVIGLEKWEIFSPQVHRAKSLELTP